MIGVIASAGDSLRLTADGATHSYSLGAVRRLEVSDGTRSRWQTGAAVGLLIGGGATYFVTHSGGSTAPCDRDQNQDAMSGTECLGLVALGGAVGAGLGALIGGRIRSERWRHVPLERLRFGLGPRGGVLVEIAVRLRPA
jgi:hypothetical protein